MRRVASESCSRSTLVPEPGGVSSVTRNVPPRCSTSYTSSDRSEAIGSTIARTRCTSGVSVIALASSRFARHRASAPHGPIHKTRREPKPTPFRSTNQIGTIEYSWPGGRCRRERWSRGSPPGRRCPGRLLRVGGYLLGVLRMSTMFLRTLRDDPNDAEVPSHRLLVRAGYIRRSAPGGFSWLPLGWIVYRNVESIVRAEMDAAGFQEVHFPALLPREPYEASGRWTEYGDLLFRLKDRRGNDYLI